MGWRARHWTTREGKVHDGYIFRESHIYKKLANPLYTVRIPVDGGLCPAQNELILDQ